MFRRFFEEGLAQSLAREGVTDIINVVGGMSAYRVLEKAAT